MNYKMVVVDLDDSLLGNDLKISQENKRIIRKAAEKGVLVTVATGRMAVSALPYVRELKLDVPFISYQGSLITHPKTCEVLLKRSVPMDVTREIVLDCMSKGLYIQVYLDDDYYFAKENDYSRYYHKITGIKGKEVGNVLEFLDKEPVKLLIMEDPSRIMDLYKRYSKLFKDRVQITMSKPTFLEITHIEATKGKAVEHLATMYGYMRDEIIAIGDSYNDISMIEYAGLGVAMGNARDDVKKIADYVTHTNEEFGVGRVIEEFILKGVAANGFDTGR